MYVELVYRVSLLALGLTPFQGLGQLKPDPQPSSTWDCQTSLVLLLFQ